MKLVSTHDRVLQCLSGSEVAVAYAKETRMCSVIKTTTRRKEQRIPPPVRKLALPQLMFPKPFLLNMPPHAAIAADAASEAAICSPVGSGDLSARNACVLASRLRSPARPSADSTR